MKSETTANRCKKGLSAMAAMAAAICIGAGCGAKTEQSLDLGNGVMLDVVKTPDNIWWGKYEVTQAQWEAVTKHRSPVMYRKQIASDKPVQNLGAEDLQEFLTKLNRLPSVKKAGLEFRLPDLAEWEKACLAGAESGWPRMADGTAGTLERLAWYDGDIYETRAVGRKEANAYGLHDMLGNVCEATTTDGFDSMGTAGKWYAGGSMSWEADDFVEPGRCGESKDTASCSFNGFRVCAPAKGYKAPPKAETMREPKLPGWENGQFVGSGE